MSVGDKILSENYFQHADHFTRILSEQEVFKKSKFTENNQANLDSTSNNNKKDDASENTIKETSEKIQTEAS